MDLKIKASIPPYPAFRRAGDFVFVSGQNAEVDGRIEGNIQDQTRTALELIQVTLAQAGCTFADVVKVNGFIASDELFGGFNEVYRKYFNPQLSSYPARSMALGVLHQKDGALIEIEMVAYKKA